MTSLVGGVWSMMGLYVMTQLCLFLYIASQILLSDTVALLHNQLISQNQISWSCSLHTISILPVSTSGAEAIKEREGDSVCVCENLTAGSPDASTQCGVTRVLHWSHHH